MSAGTDSSFNRSHFLLRLKLQEKLSNGGFADVLPEIVGDDNSGGIFLKSYHHVKQLQICRFCINFPADLLAFAQDSASTAKR